MHHQQPDPLPHQPQSSLQTHPKILPIIRKYFLKNKFQRRETKQILKSNSKTGTTFRLDKDNPNRDENKFFRNVEKILKRQNSPSEFNYFLHGSDKFQNAFFAAKLKNLSTISSLQLSILEQGRQTLYLQKFLKSLVSLKNLTRMEFDFSSFYLKAPNTPSKLLKTLQYLTKLTYLSLVLYIDMDCRPNQIDVLFYLEKLTQIRHLKVEITSYRESNDKNLLTILSSVLPKLPNLTQVEVSLRYKKLKASHLIELFAAFRDTKTLSHITLDLYYSQVIDGKNTETLAEGVGYLNPERIRKLDLNLAPDQSFALVAQSLKRFSFLNILYLKFSGWKIDAQEDIVELSSALKNFMSLSSLSLDFSSVKSGTFFIESIASALKCLNNLSLLKLRFPTGTKATEEHIQQFFSSLRNMNNLQFLHISLENQQFISDVTLMTLADSLKTLKSLRNLALNFSMNDKITNRGVVSICSAIQGLPNLSSLTLNFSKNSNIDEEAVEKIFEIIRCFPCLYSVVACLYKCPKLSEKEKDLKSSFDSLRKTKSFVEGKLDISFCGLFKSRFEPSEDEADAESGNESDENPDYVTN